MPERLVLLGGVAPVEIIIPDPVPPAKRSVVLASLASRVIETDPGKSFVVRSAQEKDLLFEALREAVAKQVRLDQMADIFRGVDEDPLRKGRR